MVKPTIGTYNHLKVPKEITCLQTHEVGIPKDKVKQHQRAPDFKKQIGREQPRNKESRKKEEESVEALIIRYL